MASRSQRRAKAKARKQAIMEHIRNHFREDYANARKSEPRIKLTVTQVTVSLRTGKVRPAKVKAIDTLERSTTVDSITLCEQRMARALGKGASFKR